MKKIMDFSGANIAPASAARDYNRGWEIAQKEYLRQQKQEQRQNIHRSVARSSIISQ